MSGDTVWEAALGRRVVLIEARTWFTARDIARAMLGGEPTHVGEPAKYYPEWEVFPCEPGQAYAYRSTYWDTGASYVERWTEGPAPLL